MKKKTQKLWVIMLALMLLVAVPIIWALSTQTQVNFNVGTVVAYTLTLPGQGAVSANATGAQTAAIEFNSSTGTDTDVNARVVGGATQADGTPIFQFDNTGTVDLNVSVSLNSATPSCMNMTGATTYAGANSGTQITNTTNVTVINNFGSADAAQDWYMKTDFASCVSADTTQKTLYSFGVQS